VPPIDSRIDTSRRVGWVASSTVSVLADRMNANVRGVGSALPGMTIGGDRRTPSGTDPNERMVSSAGLAALGGLSRSMIASSLGLRNTPSASAPLAE
jgi:hypothetical protein